MKKLGVLVGCCLMLASVSLVFAFDDTDNKKAPAKETLPAKYDLRLHDCVTPIRRQAGGTCWAHGTMAAIESNLLKSGTWKKHKMAGLPNLAEYHLDWWNGFNRFHNTDVKEPGKTRGLRVHVGGDYRVAAAYISRGDGVVYAAEANDKKLDTVWYKAAPKKTGKTYKRFYVRDIEWMVIGKKLENINAIKKRIMTEGAVGTAYCVSRRYLTKENIHYQTQKSTRDPNHSVAIVGWDDAKITKNEKLKPPGPGAWLIKNSWGTKRGNKGYYWISYYDKHCCRHPEMGAVSFRNTEPLRYQHFYLHDYHGWRDQIKVAKIFNAYKATGKHRLTALSFYTTGNNVTYTAKIFRRFEDGKLYDAVATKKGTAAVSGFHTVDLDNAVSVQEGERIYVYLEVSNGEQAIDRTSEIAVLLGRKSNKPIVLSKAQAGESYYHDGTAWKDLYEYDFDDPNWATFDRTANFCIKALGVD